MAATLRRILVRRLPGVGWRADLLDKRARQVADLRTRLAGSEERVAAHRARISTLQDQLTQATAMVASARRQVEELRSAATRPAPSFRRQLMELRRGAAPLRAMDPHGYHPALQIPRKLRNYRLAASHGIPIPQVHAVWPRLAEIDLSGLPDEFVLKGEIGSSGKGVFPLRRVDAEHYQLIGGDEVHTRESLVELLTDHPSVWGPYFAEEFLTQRVTSEQIPDDVKIYACYGRVLMVMLRQMPRHADLRTARYRYLDDQGRDLGEDAAPDRNVHSSIPPPEPFEDFVRLAEHLSRAVALPFIRVDVYDTTRGPVLGELTRSPGGSQRYRDDLDAAWGHAWDEARWRLDLDLIDGRPLHNLHGLHPVPDYYHAAHRSNRADPKGWRVVTADCSRWCFGGPDPTLLDDEVQPSSPRPRR